MSTPPPWTPAPGGPPPMGGVAPVNGQTIMIMGIVSLLCFGIILGPIAWIQGNAALKTLQTYGDPTNQLSSVTTGRICGMIGTILSALGLVSYLIFFIVVGAAGLSHPHTPTP